MASSYKTLLAKLLQVNIQGGIKLGLDNCLKLNKALGNPANAFPSVHVAGTNGKGSVTTKISAALQHAGYKTGKYTSPHIACFRERIQIDGVMISESAVERHLSHIFNLCEQENIPATFFEITTLMAFCYFAEEKVDIAVIETGLGGRFDATNIVNTKLSVITSISLEHTEILGDTIEKIAFEKAGIIKQETPVILGPRLPSQIFEQIAEKLNSPCIRLSGTFKDFCEENEAIANAALTALHIPQDSIIEGLKALPPCRLEILTKGVICDVAHNKDGILHLLQAIKIKFPDNTKKLRFVIGISKSKDVKGIFELIKEAASHIHLVEATNGRAATNQYLLNELINLGVCESDVTCEESIQKGVKNAILEAQNNGEILVICGTFFIMAEARKALGINEPRDPEDLNER